MFNIRQPCRHGEMIFNRNDLYIGRSLQLYGEFSELEVDLLRRLIQPGAVVVEAGANIGSLTVALSRIVGPTGAVIAFEPQRLVFHLLCANLALNSIANVFAYQKAIGASRGSLLVPQLDPESPNNFGGLSLGQAQAGEPVEVTALDDMRFPRLDLLKADVEGMESQVLEGASNTVAQHRPILYLEDDRAEASAALRQRIASLGYRMYRHTPTLFNHENFARNPENVFPQLASGNLLAVPKESGWTPPDDLPYLYDAD